MDSDNKKVVKRQNTWVSTFVDTSGSGFLRKVKKGKEKARVETKVDRQQKWTLEGETLLMGERAEVLLFFALFAY